MNRKKIVNVVGAVFAAVVLLFGTSFIGYTAISQTSGLAVAQSNTQWNNVIDASRGDGQSSGILSQALYMFNGLTFDRARGDSTNGLDVDVTRMPGGAFSPADATTNPTNIQGSETFPMVFNGSTWDRTRTVASGGLFATGLLASGNMVFDGSSSWFPQRAPASDGMAVTGLSAAAGQVFNGSTWDRRRSASATNNTATTSVGVAYTTPLSTWSIIDTDIGATQSTVSRAAGGGTVRHVATSVTICRGDTAAAAPALVHLRDGATGAGTILRSWVIGVGAGLSQCENVTGLNMTGSANTAMTLEFAAAGAATSTSTVTLTGYSTP